jgi:ketosteroid isomerase-like protein
MKKSIEDEIQEMIDRETNAWNSNDAEALIDIFHPDMVWPWPKDENAHDPIDWICPMGRYDRERWKNIWQELFDTNELVHNRRTTVKITVTDEHDGAFAVVDVDTLWRHRQIGECLHWKGRACKVYTKVGAEWKLISHYGLFKYDKQCEG